MIPQLKQQNFQYQNINSISKKQFDVHMDLYGGYIKKINEIWDKLYDNSTDKANRAEANAVYSQYRGLKQGETFALDGAILHELYFANLGGLNKSPYGNALELIENDFGSYDNWKNDFIACGKAARGWAILAYDQRSKRLHNFMSDAHDLGAIWIAFPIIVMDVYEHAYFIDYTNKKADYINSFLNDINWDVINGRAKVINK